MVSRHMHCYLDFLYLLVSLNTREMLDHCEANLSMQHSTGSIFCHGTLIMHVGLVSFMHDPLPTVTSTIVHGVCDRAAC